MSTALAGRKVDPPAGCTDGLPSRVRRAIASRDPEELLLLQPVIHGLAHGLITVREIQHVSVDAALLLLRDRHTDRVRGG